MSTPTMRAAVRFWDAARIDLPMRLRCRNKCRPNMNNKAAPKIIDLTMGKVIPSSSTDPL